MARTNGKQKETEKDNNGQLDLDILEWACKRKEGTYRNNGYQINRRIKERERWNHKMSQKCEERRQRFRKGVLKTCLSWNRDKTEKEKGSEK